MAVSVYFGYDKSAVVDVDSYFNHVYNAEWFDDPFVKEMVKSIDNSEVVSRYCINSPIFGQIPPLMLSGGVKTCIMLYKLDDFVPDLIVCGENCEKWLSEIFKMKETVKVIMSGYDLTFSGLWIKGICENDGSVISNSEDWIIKMSTMVGEEGNER
jgi:hypothetical protein